VTHQKPVIGAVEACGFFTSKVCNWHICKACDWWKWKSHTSKVVIGGTGSQSHTCKVVIGGTGSQSHTCKVVIGGTITRAQVYHPLCSDFSVLQS
jgi:hypothetical protein